MARARRGGSPSGRVRRSVLSFLFRGARRGRPRASPLAAAFRRRPNSGVRYYFVKILVGKCSRGPTVAAGVALALNMRKTQKNEWDDVGAPVGPLVAGVAAASARRSASLFSRAAPPAPAPRAAASLVVSFIYLESDVYFICARRARLRREDLPSKALNVRVEAGPGAP